MNTDELSPGRAGVRCVVADDHPAVRQALARLLADNGFEVVGEATSGAEATAAIEALRPAVAIIDAVMPDFGGVEVVRRARVCSPETAAIVYSGAHDEGRLADALNAGARGFVLKDAPVEDLLLAIATVGRGEIYIDPAVGAGLVGNPALTRKAPELSARERDILRLLAAGMTTKEIAGALFISPETVRTYVRRAMQKLEAVTRTQAVAIAVRRSLIP